MATSSRQSTIFGVNDWKTIYQTFSQASFQSYDYETLRKSFVDYLRTYYPETFNDYTESSEYIALLDVIAYMGQALAFRDDLNTRENFIDTAERRDSVIKLANLIGYNPKRNLSGQGYLKVTSVQTSESINDINGFNLSGISILWNDPANANWQEQFNSVINAALIGSQRVGRPGNSKSILGITTDEYSMQIPITALPVIPFSTIVQGSKMNFEAVSVTSLGKDYIYEISPKPQGKFNILYRNDNLGYGSANTGFFMYFKQGSLQNYDFTLAQKISNQLVDINIEGISEDDTWLYKINAVTGALTEWTQVDSVYATTDTTVSGAARTFFSVKSRFNDQVSYTFGDGVFGEIPIGTFRSYVRTGNAIQYTIDPSEMQGTSITISYVSKVGRTETLTIQLSLTEPVSNAQTRESLDNIKLRAPTKYYSQNRMVNGEDYNTFPNALYSSIIKSKSLNRSSIGVARNFDLLDPTGKYSSVNSFAQDGALYQVDTDRTTVFSLEQGANSIISFLTNRLLGILASTQMLQHYNAAYPRYLVNYNVTVGSTTVLNKPIWNKTSYSGTNVTGYFKLADAEEVTSPIPVGIYTSENLKYCTAGALLKFVPPAGYYFTDAGLVAGLATPSSKMYIWATVVNVVDDGYNGGEGNLSTGLGPVALSANIPTGALLETILPAFDNVLPNLLIQSAITRANINQSFSLVYDNSFTMNLPRWSITDYSETNYLVNFKSLGDGKYSVSSKALSYYFGSVKDTRFTYDRNKVIYDPLTGKLLYDTVKILKTNSLFGNNYSFADDINLAVIGQTVESDGYVDDYSIEVSSINPNNNGLANDPDFFKYVTGYTTASTNSSQFVFVRQVIDANLLNQYEIVPSTDVNYAFSSESKIALAKYDYPLGQVFFAYTDNKFFTTVQDDTSANIVNLASLTNYTALTGRQGLYFHYRHNSSNTTRINPGTTNIIDIYVVTSSYYTQYSNWIQDATNKLPEPAVPTIYELKQSYSKVDEYKMLSDTVLLNSVKFKPLFGSKASLELQATIKVIKNSNITASDSEIRIATINAMNTYFDISNWNFGDTFYFSELSAYLHSEIGDLISSAILVPNNSQLTFGDLYEIRSAPYEIFVNAAQATDIVVISSLTADQLKPNS